MSKVGCIFNIFSLIQEAKLEDAKNLGADGGVLWARTGMGSVKYDYI